MISVADSEIPGVYWRSCALEGPFWKTCCVWGVHLYPPAGSYSGETPMGRSLADFRGSIQILPSLRPGHPSVLQLLR